MMRKYVHKAVRSYGRLIGRDPLWISQNTARISRKIDEVIGGTIEDMRTRKARSRLPGTINASSDAQKSDTDKYWSRHTVRGKTFLSKEESLDYIRELTDGRPFKRELLNLHGPHEGEVIMDYGCGPGNDLAGFAEHSSAARIIGVDISPKALQLARARVSWHARDPEQMSFIRISDKDVRMPLDDASIDYIQSLGVIHHASDPNAIFKEFHRVLKPGCEARIMLYNADSVHIQLHIGYIWRFVSGMLTDKTPEEAFSHKADLGAPIAHCVRPADVTSWLKGVPLKMEFVGGYFMPREEKDWKERRKTALADERISSNQRKFLKALKDHKSGFPHYNGKPAGLGGVYVLKKAAK